MGDDSEGNGNGEQGTGAIDGGMRDSFSKLKDSRRDKSSICSG